MTVTARDTQKMCFQLADTTIWVLTDDSPKRWTWVSGKNVDSLYMRTFLAVTAGITRISTDSSYHRVITADSATIPVFKGTKTFRDSSYFAGGLRGLRLYMQRGSIDTLYSNIMGLGTTTPQHRLHVNGNIRATAGNIGISNSVTSPTGEWYFYVGSDKGLGLKDNISNTFPITIDSGAGNYGISIERGGLIGVNTNTPDSNLTVVGSAHVTGNARIDGSLEVNGTVTASGFAGPLTGNVSGSSGSCTGNAATATTATRSDSCTGGAVRATTATTATTATNVSGGTVSVSACSSSSGYKFNGGSTLQLYKVETLPCSLFENSTYKVSGTAFLTWFDNLIFITFPTFSTTIDGGGNMIIKGIPDAYFNSYDQQYQNITVYYNSKNNSNFLNLTTSGIYVRDHDNLSYPAGNYSIKKTTVMYRRLY